MGAIKILAYSDKKYQYQIESLIKSLHLRGHDDIEFIYYTIGFESDLQYPNLTKKIWPVDLRMRSFNFYKPGICLDAIRSFGGNIVFMDSDVVVSKRFDPNFFIHDREYPLMSIGNWELPYYWRSVDANGAFPIFNILDRVLSNTEPLFGNVMEYNYQDLTYLVKLDNIEIPVSYRADQLCEYKISDYSKLMHYYGVKDRTMTYVYSCLISLNNKCEDFIAEWKSIAENEYLNRFGNDYYPISDETPMNVTLWKRKVTENYGRIFVNTLYSDVVQHVEENDDILNTQIFGDPLQMCTNSSTVKFYHGMIDPEEINKTTSYIKKQQTNDINIPRRF
jgi:hypothetical protein